MLNRTRVIHRCLALLVGPALLCVAGCSDDGVGKRYPVSGTVKYKGEPVAKARISLYPKGGGRGAYGEVENGTFSSMTTQQTGDGAMPGVYKVTVDTRQIDDAKVKSDAAEVAKKHGMDGMGQVPQELSAKSLKNAKSTIPGKYQIPDTSDIEVTVKEQSNDLKIELKD
jgi:hypothetical protein